MRIVGLGASAGGMEALIELLSELSDNTGAAYVLILHLSPNHQSIMDELLSRHTSLPISIVDNITPVQADHIYIISKDKNLTLKKDMLIPHPRAPENGLNLPIDQFFHSLGKSQKEKAIGVILSGTGTDGSRGVRTIKEAGGLVLVQSPESAKFDGMPQEVIRLQLADKILPPGELAKMLTDIVEWSANGSPEEGHGDEAEGPAVPQPFLERILLEVKKVTGIDFSGYREPTLNRRLGNRVLLHRLSDPEKYLDLLKESEEEIFALQKDFLIGVTRFFRNPMAFEVLEQTVLPRLFEQKDKGDTLRVWVPACSTGEEAYSIAMVIARYLEKNELHHDFKIFGTDIDSGAIKLASEGIFSYNCAADLPGDLLFNYFRKESDFYRVKGAIRDKMLFAVHNLLGDPPFIHMDLISCRNALIYFKNTTQSSILSTFHFALNPSGYLFLGPSESLGDVKHAYTQLNKKWNIFQKKENTQLPYQSRFRSGPSHIQLIPSGNKYAAAEPSTHGSKASEPERPDPFTHFLLDNYAPTVLFVNKALDVLYIQGKIEHLFNFPKGASGFNLRNMLSPEKLMTFRKGVMKSLEQAKVVGFKGIELEKNGKIQNIDLRFRRVQLTDVQEEVVMLELFTVANRPKAVEIELDEGQNEALLKDHVRMMEDKLDEAKQNSKELVTQLESTNEELQSANRELLAANEELQSTNEELQSVNEELYTVNNELQIKNENLTTANNDINNLLKSTEIGTIFLDANLRIRRFTPAVRQQFHLLEGDIGRSITDFSSTLQDIDIAEMSRQVYGTLQSFEQEVTDQQGNHYLLRILPYRTERNELKGLVINFVDVNELMKVKGQIETFANKFQAIFQYSNEIIMVLDIDGTIHRVNKAFGGSEASELAGENLSTWLPEDQGAQIKTLIARTCTERKPHEIELELGDEPALTKSYNACIIPVIEEDKQEVPINKIIIIWQDLNGPVRMHQ